MTASINVANASPGHFHVMDLVTRNFTDPM